MAPVELLARLVMSRKAPRALKEDDVTARLKSQYSALAMCPRILAAVHKFADGVALHGPPPGFSTPMSCGTIGPYVGHCVERAVSTLLMRASRSRYRSQGIESTSAYRRRQVSSRLVLLHLETGRRGWKSYPSRNGAESAWRASYTGEKAHGPGAQFRNAMLVTRPVEHCAASTQTVQIAAPGPR